MNKIRVEIHIPVAQKVLEVFLPLHLRMGEIIRLVSKMAIDMTGGLFNQSEETVLCNKEDGSILDMNASVLEAGLKNGTKLVLI